MYSFMSPFLSPDRVLFFVRFFVPGLCQWEDTRREGSSLTDQGTIGCGLRGKDVPHMFYSTEASSATSG